MAGALLAVTATGCADDPVAPTAQRLALGLAPLHTRDAASGIPDRYIVVFKEGVRDVPGLAQSLVSGQGGSIHYTYHHAIQGFAATLPTPAVEALRRNPNVAYVEQDGVVRTTGTVQSNATWGLDRIDQREFPLNATYTYNGDGAGVNVYVIDTGIEAGHPEFGGRAANVYDVFGGSGEDCNGHGTHVAGTIGSTSYGVAKGVALRGVRVLGCDGSGYTSGVIAGVDWVTYYHTRPAVANMSLVSLTDPALDQAVRNSIAAGVTYSIAAGNDGVDACNVSPARVTEAITVGATDQYDTRATFLYGSSNFGNCLDLFAPGANITSTWLNGGTNTTSGTSMAAPHVAGVAALYLQENPGAPPVLVRDRIVYNSTVWAVQNAGANSPPHLLLSWTGIRRRVAFRTIDGIHYIQAVNGGGSSVRATPSWIQAWEHFWLMDLNGGDLRAGDPVNIKTGNDEWFLVAQGGGGPRSVVDANARFGHSWERFVIGTPGGGGGQIFDGMQIQLRAYQPYYVVAENGGGGAVNANRSVASGWETFYLVFL
jgi:hypothetical protein